MAGRRRDIRHLETDVLVAGVDAPAGIQAGAGNAQHLAGDVEDAGVAGARR